MHTDNNQLRHPPMRTRARLIQLAESLSYGDAVSDHVFALHRMLVSLGFEAQIYSKWCDARIQEASRPLEELEINDQDVVIFHFCGHSEHALPQLAESYCTKVLQYHNITPHEFFQEGSRLYEFCKKGREQLRAYIGIFHALWADSNYNLSELHRLRPGSTPSAVIPIVVPPPVTALNSCSRTPGTWLFVGRIAPNKGQLNLVRLFAQTQRSTPRLATGLILAGGWDEGDPYYEELLAAVRDEGVTDCVRVAGKVEASEIHRLYNTAAVYVSLSQHEGFGAPLVEAALHGLPVVALDAAAVPETLGSAQGLVRTPQEVPPLIDRLATDDSYRASLLQSQFDNARRFNPPTVANLLEDALAAIIPRPKQFASVSIVVCTYNRLTYLERLLDYLRYQSSKHFEVIVVDGPSTDGTKQFLEQSNLKIKIAHNPERNLSKSRNIGISLAAGDIIGFLDDDALPFDSWVECVLSSYNSRPLTTAGLGGPAYFAGTFRFQAEDNGINKFGEAYVNIPSAQIGKDGWKRYNTGTNATFRTDLLREIGGFDEEFDYYLDESEVCYRVQAAGYLISYVPSLYVRHEFAQSHNRSGRYRYNWRSISKNTAYFAARHSQLADSDLSKYVETRLQRERIDEFKAALDAGAITAADYKQFVNEAHSGTQVGLAAAKSPAKLRNFTLAAPSFIPFTGSPKDYLPHFPGDPLHICVVTREFPGFSPSGGVGTLYYHLCSELLLMGHRVSVVVPASTANSYHQGNFSVYSTPPVDVNVSSVDPAFVRNIAWSTAVFRQIADIHENHPIDVVDSSLWDSEALALALLPPHARPKLVVRLVTPYALSAEINGWEPDAQVAEFFIAAEAALLSGADAIVPISKSICSSVEEIHKISRGSHWSTVLAGIPYWPYFDVNSNYDSVPQLESLPNGLLESGKYILFLGRLERRKGIDLLLEASVDFLTAAPGFHLILAGRDVDNWQARANEHPVAERVHFLGEVEDAVRDKLLARAFCLAFPSRYESFGLVPLEAFVHGVPVVATRVAAIPEVIEDGISGLLFEPGSRSELAGAITNLTRLPGLREKLSEGARARVRTLSSRRMANTSVHLYRSLVTRDFA